MSNELNARARTATKWSLLTELLTRVVTPVTQLVLARLLAPDAFGVLATVVMVASFAEMLADAGFQKYLIQHQFETSDDLDRSSNVAFWSSLLISLALLSSIIIWRDPIASMVGIPGLGLPVAISATTLPLTVLASTQRALFIRAFEYRKVLPIRLTAAVLPLVISVPLALYGKGYWALIIGIIGASLLSAVWLTIASDWKPRFYFSFSLLRRMFEFSTWSLLEAVAIWATQWAGVLVVSTLLTPHELGLYRQPMVVVNSTFALVSSAATPVLFAALARLQDNRDQFQSFFLQFQFATAVALFPIGIGAFLYRDFFVDLFFGPLWSEAALMFGAWGISTSFVIVLSHYYSEVFRALGKPRVSLLAQCLYMAVMIPALYFAALDGFRTLVVVNALIRVVLIIINLTLAYIVGDLSPQLLAKNLYIPIIASVIMGIPAVYLARIVAGNWSLNSLSILSCAVLYTAVCLCFTRTRRLLIDAAASLRRRPRSSSS